MNEEKTKLVYPAADRNKEPIRAALTPFLPVSGLVLEIASGTGQHCTYFAEHFPQLTWQPSDREENHRSSILCYRKQSGLSNILEPLAIDVCDEPWPITKANFIFNANMIHISPRETCPALFRGASLLLASDERLALYGPFKFSDREVAQSNLEFEKMLQQKDSRFGLWQVEAINSVAARNGFEEEAVVEMPANNHLLTFKKI